MVKKQLKKFKDKFIKFCKWIVDECKDWHTILLLLVVAAILFTPVWGGYLIWLLFGWQWGFVLATATVAVLIGPVPFWVISIAITLGIKKLFEKKQEHDQEKLSTEAETDNKEALENGEITGEDHGNIDENK